MDFLIFNKQKGSAVIKKLLESAIANAENNNKADIDLLSVKSIIVNQGKRLKRMKTFEEEYKKVEFEKVDIKKTNLSNEFIMSNFL